MRTLVLQGVVAGLLLLLTVASAAAEDPNPPSIHSNRGAWPIRRQWNRAETLHYAKWIEHVFKMKTEGAVEQRCAKLETVLTDPEMNLLLDPEFLGEDSNPQMPARLMRRMHHLMDCGKFTAFMPAYYAYRRALPWMVAYVRSGGGDVRTAKGNTPVGSANSFTSPSLNRFFTHAIQGFGSGNYRVELTNRNARLSDTVPVAITQEYLLPGCINYIEGGHCLILARVSPYGELQFINCSTAKTRDIFTYNGMNTVYGVTPRDGEDPGNAWAKCYDGLRVLRYPIAEVNSRGHVVKVRRRTDEEMAEFGFSTEQYERAAEMVSSKRIEVGGLVAESFADFVRLRMKTVDTIAPAPFMEQYADELVDVFKFRDEFVQNAWRDVQEHGPIVYPEELSGGNIFQASGRWETWSSPSSDVDRRNKYFYLADWCEYAVRMFGMSPESVDLTGLEKWLIECQADLALALIEEKKRIFAERSMSYINSEGEPVELTLTEIEKRLYDFSFDPNHPPELRWGAPLGSAERATAPETFTPTPSGVRVPMEQGYKLQAYYRTVCTRETEMSYFRDMFTDGYPTRFKFDQQLSNWSYKQEPTEAIQAWLDKQKPPEEPKEPPFVLVPRNKDAIIPQ